VQYGQQVTKTYKTFLATWRPAGGLIRVVVVREEDGWLPFFSTNPEATVVEILEGAADRGAHEQTFKDVKEVWGAGEQQLRNVRPRAPPRRRHRVWFALGNINILGCRLYVL
jgi:hypothetical protein